MIQGAMTPGEKNIVKSLIAVAWADGRIEESETSVVEGMLAGFDATEAEEAELIEYAKTPRTLDRDIPLSELDHEERELLLSNAALLTLADGKRSLEEARALSHLVKVLDLGEGESRRIISEAQDGALQLPMKSLD
jgi:tellurite resistance protein